jgi:hypothetical protein
VEDGELELEFFYEPGKFEVHPALGRVAILLRPEGAALHKLTDAQYDRTGLAPDNAEPLPGAAPVALKNADWNTLQLAIAASEVTFTLNGQPAGRLALDGANDRTFGLFRYADVSGVRVRNVVLRGTWPRDLSAVTQELAGPEAKTSR